MNEGKKPAIVAFLPGPWRWPEVAGSTRYHLWNLAGLGWNVLAIDPPLKIQGPKKVWRAPDRPFASGASPFTLPFAVRAARTGLPIRSWRDFTSDQLASTAIGLCHELKWRPQIYWFGAPWHDSLLRHLSKTPKRVFHVYDELAESSVLGAGPQRRLKKWEDRLIQSSDLVLCSSRPQFEKRREGHTRVELLENAVADGALTITKDSTVPEEYQPFVEKIKKLPSPRIAYGGVADGRLSYRLIEAVLDSFPDTHLAILGNVDKKAPEKLRSLLGNHERVHCFGRLPYGAYPYLYAQSDVLLIAHGLSAFTKPMLPEKLNEYLASGRPVVSVPLPEVVRVSCEAEHPDAIRIGEDAHGYVDAVRAALDETDESLQKVRRRLAEKRTWSRTAKQADQYLRELINPSGDAGGSNSKVESSNTEN